MSDRPAMLVDIMWPLLSVLEANQDAPMREAVTWELQIADSTDDADLRDAYADRLHEWGCAKREADVRKESAQIRNGKTIPLRRWAPLIGIRYPQGATNVGTDENPTFRDNHHLARDLVENWMLGSKLILPSDRAYDAPGCYEWDVIPHPGAPVPEVERAKT